MALRVERAAAERPAHRFEAVVEARVVGADARGSGVALELDDVRAAEPAAGRVPRRLELWLDAAAGSGLLRALPGDRVRLRARVQPAWGLANPGGRDVSAALARRGIGARARLVQRDLAVRLVDDGSWRPLAPLRRLRARAAERLIERGPGGALLAALSFGERAGLSTATRDSFRRAGLAHLLAVSGLHLALAAALAFRVAFAARHLGRRRARGDARRVALTAACATAGAYAVLAGWGVPVQRALVLLAGVGAALWLRRPAHWSGPLAAAGIAVLAREPAALFLPGARLSFVASAGLLLAVRARPQRLRPVADLVGASAVAFAVTAPIAASSFGALAPWSPLTNLIAIPWTAFVLLPAALAAGVLASLPTPVVDVALAPLAAIATGSLSALERASDALPDPWPTRPPGWALLVAALLAAWVLARRGAAARALGAVAGAAVLALAPVPDLEPEPPRVVFLDVGQGDATLVQGRRGSVLVDAATARPGGFDLGRSAVLPALGALGVRRLDLLVVSHADLDHRGGVPAVLMALPVGRVWLPPGGRSDPALSAVMDAARAREVPVLERGRGAAALRLGDLRVVPLWPPQRRAGGSRNEGSLVLRIDVAGRRVLLPGDLGVASERVLLEAAHELPADVLKLPHHGSRTSSSDAFLAAVAADLVVASAPRFGRFGMPHAAVVERVGRNGAALWWTGRDGAVAVALGPTLWARGFR